jgi:hypothetical protein
MLRVFVPLPVVFAAKGFVAGQKGATIWPLVTLHVFSKPLALHTEIVESTYLNSHGRPLNLLHVWQVTRFSLLSLEYLITVSDGN